MTFAAIAAAAALSPLRAQQVPARDLFNLPIGTMAEAAALANEAGGGFWNPATVALAPGGRMLFSAAAFNAPIEQGVSAQLFTAAYQLKPALTAGVSFAQSSVADLLRTDTDPQSIGDAIPYRSTILSAMVASREGPATIGVALRRRTGTVDLSGGHATSLDIGATVDRPVGLPFRAAVSSFLLSPSRQLERATGLGAVEGYLPWGGSDLRAGVSYQLDEGGGDESFFYASDHAGVLDVRGGIARQHAFGYTTSRMRLGIGVRYAHYIVAVAREDGTSGLGASYQFLLTTVIPGMSR